MRKHYFGRQFKRDTNERKALFKSLLSELVMHERIQTTEEKAKAIKADADRLITKAKKSDRLHAYALLQPMVRPEAVRKLLMDLAPRFADRAGGYTRIVKLGHRFSDDANMAFIEWTEKKVKVEEVSPKSKAQKAAGKKSLVASEAEIVESSKEKTAKTKTSAKKAPAKKTTKAKNKEEVK